MSDYLLAQAEEPVEVVWAGDWWRKYDTTRQAPPLSREDRAPKRDPNQRERHARRFIAGQCRDCPNARTLHSVRCGGCLLKLAQRKRRRAA